MTPFVVSNELAVHTVATNKTEHYSSSSKTTQVIVALLAWRPVDHFFFYFACVHRIKNDRLLPTVYVRTIIKRLMV